VLISRNREKLINAIVYFASNTQHCGKVKQERAIRDELARLR